MIDDELQDAELREIAQRLGTRAGERLDVEATAQAVLARLREAPAVRPVWRRPAWLSLAAALVLLLGVPMAVRLRHEEVRRSAVSLVAPGGVDVTDLSPDQLRAVLKTLDEVTDDETGTADPGLDDLSAPELRRLLRSLEG